MAKNMYEDVYMNAEEFGRCLAARQIDMNRILTDMGLVPKKPWASGPGSREEASCVL